MAQPINLFDEVLRLAELKQAVTQDPEADAQAMQHLLTVEEAASAGDSSLLRVHDRLLPLLVTPPFGELLTQYTSAQTTIEVTSAVDLPATMLEQLRMDQLYPTQIPVMIMKRLLNWLQIPYEKAEIALRKTAERVKQSTDILPIQYGKLAVGRRAAGNGSIAPSELNPRSRDLYANDKALQAYLNRLSQEMSDPSAFPAAKPKVDLL